MLSEYMMLHVKLQWLKYNKEIKKIPEISQVLSMHNGGWAQFKVEDLYNGNYVLYIDEDLENTSDEFIEQILFHEFTHLADSLICHEMCRDDFKRYMHIYSEIHAAEIQMNRMLLTQEYRPFSLNQDVTHSKGILSLKYFMEQTYAHVTNEFSFPTEPILTNNFRFDSKKIFYYLGYVRSLHRNGINYQVDFSNLPECFHNIFSEILEEILHDECNSNKLLLLEIQLQEEIKKQVARHNKEHMDKFINKILFPN